MQFFITVAVVLIVAGILLRIPYLKDRKKFNDGKCKLCGKNFIKHWCFTCYMYECKNCGYKFTSDYDFVSTKDIEDKKQKELREINDIRSRNGLSTIKIYKEYKKLYK